MHRFCADPGAFECGSFRLKNRERVNGREIYITQIGIDLGRQLYTFCQQSTKFSIKPAPVCNLEGSYLQAKQLLGVFSPVIFEAEEVAVSDAPIFTLAPPCLHPFLKHFPVNPLSFNPT